MIDCFRISLKGTEEAVDGSGSNSTTYRNIFYQKEIYSTRDCRTASAGDITLNVPKECMHSFEAKNNRIIWKIVIHGEIDRRPDLREEFKFTVAPLPEELL
jgi:hypothetical protein